MRPSAIGAQKLPAPAIPIDREAVAAFCRHRGIARLDLFGSVLRTDFGPASDVDVAIEFVSQETRPRGWTYFGLGDEIAEVLCPGRRVDWCERRLLRPRIREQAEAEAFTVYAAA